MKFDFWLCVSGCVYVVWVGGLMGFLIYKGIAA